MRYCARGRQADARRRHHQHGFGQGAGAESLHDAGAMHFHHARTDTRLLADRLVRPPASSPSKTCRSRADLPAMRRSAGLPLALLLVVRWMLAIAEATAASSSSFSSGVSSQSTVPAFIAWTASVTSPRSCRHPVNLEGNSGPKRRDFVREKRSDSAIRFGDLALSRKGSLARSAAEVSRGRFGIRDVEEVRDLIVNRQKPLCLAG